MRATPTDFVLSLAAAGLLAGCPESPPTDGPAPGVQVEHWCDAGIGGAPGARGIEQDLAAGHALKRLFSVDPAWIDADARLAEKAQRAR